MKLFLWLSVVSAPMCKHCKFFMRDKLVTNDIFGKCIKFKLSEKTNFFFL